MFSYGLWYRGIVNDCVSCLFLLPLVAMCSVWLAGGTDAQYDARYEENCRD